MGSDHSKAIEFVGFQSGAATAKLAGMSPEKIKEFWNANKEQIALDHEVVEFQGVKFQQPLSPWASIVMHGVDADFLKQVIQERKVNPFTSACYLKRSAMENLIAERSHQTKVILDFCKVLCKTGLANTEEMQKKNPEKFAKTYLQASDNYENRTWLQLAATKNSGDLELFSFLLDHEIFGRSLTLRDAKGNTLVHTLVSDDKMNKHLQEFLSSGKLDDLARQTSGEANDKNFSWFNKDGMTPLMIAAEQGQDKAISELVSNNIGGSAAAQRNNNKEEGMSALHYAALKKADFAAGAICNCVETLLAAPTPGVKDLINKTILVHEGAVNKYDVKEYRDGYHHTLLTLATVAQNNQLIRALLANGAKQELPDKGKLKSEFKSLKEFADKVGPKVTYLFE